MVFHGEIYLSPADIWEIKQFLYFIVSILAWFTMGRILHEATHWFFAWLLADGVTDASIGLLRGHVEYQIDASKPVLYDRFINLSPQLLGLLLGVPYFVWVWTAGLKTLFLFVVAVFLFAYSGLGGAADFSMAVAHGDGRLWTPDDKTKVAFISLIMVCTSVATMTVNVAAPPWIAYWWEHVPMALAFGGILLLGLDLLLNRTEELA